MKKFLIILGITILLAVLLINRVWQPLTATINILLCAFAALLMVIGICSRSQSDR